MASKLELEQFQQFVDTPLLTRFEKLLVGSSALITGATRVNGIGFAIAERFALEGVSHLVLVGTERSQEEAVFVRHRLLRYGTDAHTLIGDVANKQSCVEIVRKAYELCEGNVDILVNNAGVTRDKEFTEVTVDDWMAVVDSKAWGAFWMTQEWFRLRNEEYNLRGGRVINIGSIVGEYGNFGQESYAMANGSLASLTKSLSVTLGRRGINVNLITPGFVEGTNITGKLPKEVTDSIKAVSALNSLVRAADIAGAALYLAGPDGGRITGATIAVDCGIQSNYIAVRRINQAGFRQIPGRLLDLVGELIALPHDAIEHLKGQIRSHHREGNT